MSRSAQIDVFRTGDQGALGRLIDATCAEGMMATSRFQPTPAWRRALAGADDHLLLVARSEQDVVGWCRLFPDGAGQMELGIGVARNLRRQGVGSRLLAQALRWAATQRDACVALTTRADNEPARRLFVRNGFRTVGREGDLLRMVLSLPGCPDDKERKT